MQFRLDGGVSGGEKSKRWPRPLIKNRLLLATATLQTQPNECFIVANVQQPNSRKRRLSSRPHLPMKAESEDAQLNSSHLDSEYSPRFEFVDEATSPDEDNTTTICKFRSNVRFVFVRGRFSHKIPCDGMWQKKRSRQCFPQMLVAFTDGATCIVGYFE